MKMKKTVLFLALATLMMINLSSCGRYNFIKEVSKEEKESRPRIYGEVDGPALQSKNTYPTDPDLAKNAALIKAKLFNDDVPAVKELAPAPIDTAKVMAAQKES